MPLTSATVYPWPLRRVVQLRLLGCPTLAGHHCPALSLGHGLPTQASHPHVQSNTGKSLSSLRSRSRKDEDAKRDAEQEPQTSSSSQRPSSEVLCLLTAEGDLLVEDPKFESLKKRTWAVASPRDLIFVQNNTCSSAQPHVCEPMISPRQRHSIPVDDKASGRRLKHFERHHCEIP